MYLQRNEQFTIKKQYSKDSSARQREIAKLVEQQRWFLSSKLVA